ncbi:hypothetical protein ON010_g15979 [Phytophthora cinnamomi]|nr:hypothetical protein ON010_g15979 [Phytophthora cinnamomi]
MSILNRPVMGAKIKTTTQNNVNPLEEANAASSVVDYFPPIQPVRCVVGTVAATRSHAAEISPATTREIPYEMGRGASASKPRAGKQSGLQVEADGGRTKHTDRETSGFASTPTNATNTKLAERFPEYRPDPARCSDVV